MKKENRKILYTKNALKEALRDLLMKKSIDSISVSELCRCANINRTTFYKYYTIPSDILEEVRDKLAQHLSPSNFVQDAKIYNSALARCKVLYKDIKDWQMLKKGKVNPEYNSQQVDSQLMYECKTKTGMSTENAALLYRFIQYGINGLITEWIDQKDPEPPELLAEHIAAILKLLF